ncbi:MAG TPA: SDR family NAD(P)-dependent oxidoreductase [Acidimicrobiales bacterium]
MDPRSKAAVITGAASGIGLALAEALAAEGCPLVLADRDERRLGVQADRLRSSGASVVAVPTDVADPDAVDALSARSHEAFGSVGLLCNNAGVVAAGRAWEIPVDTWHEVVGVNLMGAVHGIRSFVPAMIDAGGPGHVVNVASMAAVVPVPGIAPYNVTKHGLLALSETLQADLEQAGADIGVTVVMPGRVATALGRPVERSDDPPGPLEPGVLSPAVVAAQIVAAVRAGRRHLFTHPERLVEVEARFARILST